MEFTKLFIQSILVTTFRILPVLIVLFCLVQFFKYIVKCVKIYANTLYQNFTYRLGKLLNFYNKLDDVVRDTIGSVILGCLLSMFSAVVVFEFVAAYRREVGPLLLNVRVQVLLAVFILVYSFMIFCYTYVSRRKLTQKELIWAPSIFSIWLRHTFVLTLPILMVGIYCLNESNSLHNFLAPEIYNEIHNGWSRNYANKSDDNLVNKDGFTPRAQRGLNLFAICIGFYEIMMVVVMAYLLDLMYLLLPIWELLEECVINPVLYILQSFFNPLYEFLCDTYEKCLLFWFLMINYMVFMREFVIAVVGIFIIVFSMYPLISGSDERK